MINLKTVLILGAGASKDFGFPTGRELVEKVCTQSGELNINLELFKEVMGRQNLPTINKFYRALQLADPTSVDAWLELNSEFIWAGKVAIAMVLLSHEKHSCLKPENSWYQLLFDRLNSPFDTFQDNKLTMVTFNYDRSLEQYLFERFRNTHTTRSENECKKKLGQLEILHMYGSLGRLPWQTDDPKNPTTCVDYGAVQTKEMTIAAAKNIEIMPENSPGITGKFQRFKELMRDCQALYFLGFGYHDVNMQRLGISTLGIPPKVMGTAKGLSYQRIREIESYGIRTLCIGDGLFRKSIYDFLHGYVHFNESRYPDRRIYTI